jgi:hypothetical protein
MAGHAGGRRWWPGYTARRRPLHACMVSLTATTCMQSMPCGGLAFYNCGPNSGERLLSSVVCGPHPNSGVWHCIPQEPASLTNMCK